MTMIAGAAAERDRGGVDDGRRRPMRSPAAAASACRINADWIRDKGVYIALLLLIALQRASSHRTSTSTRNVQLIMRQVAAVLIVSLGMLMVIGTGGIDLSVGATMAIAGSVLGLAVSPGSCRQRRHGAQPVGRGDPRDPRRPGRRPVQRIRHRRRRRPADRRDAEPAGRLVAGWPWSSPAAASSSCSSPASTSSRQRPLGLPYVILIAARPGRRRRGPGTPDDLRLPAGRRSAATAGRASWPGCRSAARSSPCTRSAVCWPRSPASSPPPASTPPTRPTSASASSSTPSRRWSSAAQR